MSKAEELGKKYELSLEYSDTHGQLPSVAYATGYERAKEDLALTWQDIAKIVTLADTILDGNEEEWKIRGPEAYYSEVLRIFNENKQE